MVANRSAGEGLSGFRNLTLSDFNQQKTKSYLLSIVTERCPGQINYSSFNRCLVLLMSHSKFYRIAITGRQKIPKDLNILSGPENQHFQEKNIGIHL